MSVVVCREGLDGLYSSVGKKCCSKWETVRIIHNAHFHLYVPSTFEAISELAYIKLIRMSFM